MFCPDLGSMMGEISQWICVTILLHAYAVSPSCVGHFVAQFCLCYLSKSFTICSPSVHNLGPECDAFSSHPTSGTALQRVPPSRPQYDWIPQSPSPQVATGTCTFCSSIFSFLGGFGRSSCKETPLATIPNSYAHRPPNLLVPLSRSQENVYSPPQRSP
jgi:hypothetical protein